jgi:hypothetical protein
VAALGFAKDPFNQRVTERETYFQFNEIYVPLDESLLDQLSDHAQSAFCFAEYGMGKSATRLALEYKLRLEPAYDSLLCVRYIPSHAADIKSESALLDDLCHEIAIDSVIQVVERSQRQPQNCNPAFLAALRYQAALLPTWFRRFIQSHVPLSGETEHDGVFWPIAERPAVESISPGQTWHALMAEIRDAITAPPGRPSWPESIIQARALGFKQIFILIDAVDEIKQHPQRWMPFLDNLFDFLPRWQEKNIFVKAFLPTAVQTMFLDRYNKLIEGLTPPPHITTIGAKITETHLEQILLERLAAVKPQPFQETRLSVLVGVHLSESIESWLAHQANGSPRRVLELASRFLDFHADHVYSNGGRLDISPAEWTRYKAFVGGRSP